MTVHRWLKRACSTRVRTATWGAGRSSGKICAAWLHSTTSAAHLQQPRVAPGEDGRRREARQRRGWALAQLSQVGRGALSAAHAWGGDGILTVRLLVVVLLLTTLHITCTCIVCPHSSQVQPGGALRTRSLRSRHTAATLPFLRVDRGEPATKEPQNHFVRQPIRTDVLQASARRSRSSPSPPP